MTIGKLEQNIVSSLAYSLQSLSASYSTSLKQHPSTSLGKTNTSPELLKQHLLVHSSNGRSGTQTTRYQNPSQPNI
jgi:hypothetical protein